jgi:cytochrome c-type biogenesis protein CcmH
MSAFLLASGTLLALALAFILVPLLRGPRRSTGADPLSVNRAVYQDQREELNREWENGLLTDAQYQEALDELKRRMLRDLDTAPSASSTLARGGGRFILPVLLALAVPIASILLYLQIGSLDALRLASTEPLSPSPADVETMVARLAQRLEEHPEDAKGWALLGRSYSALGRFDQAAAAFERASALDPDNAAILADLADALAMGQGRSLLGKPGELLTRALEIDPRHPKSLALAGAAAFERGDYAAAVLYWERLAAQLEPGSELAERVQESLSEARDRLSKERAGQQESGAPAAARQGRRLAGVATLSPALAARVKPDDTLFIYARAAEGPPMPLAILRAKASDLPLSFTLDEGMGMVPGVSLSGVPKVMVIARISKSGSAELQSGDLVGSAGPVAPNARDVRIVIDRITP